MNVLGQQTTANNTQATNGSVHFSYPFLGTYEVIQFIELANLEGTPFQGGKYMGSTPIP